MAFILVGADPELSVPPRIWLSILARRTKRLLQPGANCSGASLLKSQKYTTAMVGYLLTSLNDVLAQAKYMTPSTMRGAILVKQSNEFCLDAKRDQC